MRWCLVIKESGVFCRLLRCLVIKESGVFADFYGAWLLGGLAPWLALKFPLTTFELFHLRCQPASSSAQVTSR